MVTLKDVEALAKSVYGEGVEVGVGAAGESVFQSVVIHPAGVPLVLVTARTEAAALNGMNAALEAVKD